MSSERRRTRGHLSWEWVDRRLRSMREIWVATASPEGRADAVPVWFWWDGEQIYFSTKAESRKARNMRRRPHVVLHNGDGADPIIVKGEARRTPDRWAAEETVREQGRQDSNLQPPVLETGALPIAPRPWAAGRIVSARQRRHFAAPPRGRPRNGARHRRLCNNSSTGLALRESSCHREQRARDARGFGRRASRLTRKVT